MQSNFVSLLVLTLIAILPIIVTFFLFVVFSLIDFMKKEKNKC